MQTTLDEHQTEDLRRQFMAEILSDLPSKILPDRPSCLVPPVLLLAGCMGFGAGTFIAGIAGIAMAVGSLALINYFRAERLMQNIGRLRDMGFLVFVDRHGCTGARHQTVGIPSDAACWAWSAQRGWSLWGECKTAYYRTIDEARARK
jgi:hypothetical protein